MDTQTFTTQPNSFRRDKLVLARVLAQTPWHAAARAVEKKLGLMRVFNTHATPPRYAASFARQLDHLLSRYEAVDPYRLEEALELGPSGRRPLAVFTFDDAFRNQFEVAAAELEGHGARGIFSVPAEFPSVPPGKQIEWCRRHIRWNPDAAEHARDDDLFAMSWDQARELVARGHRICCHSLSHEVLSPRTSRRTLEAEVVGRATVSKTSLGSLSMASAGQSSSTEAPRPPCSSFERRTPMPLLLTRGPCARVTILSTCTARALRRAGRWKHSTFTPPELSTAPTFCDEFGPPSRDERRDQR